MKKPGATSAATGKRAATTKKGRTAKAKGTVKKGQAAKATKDARTTSKGVTAKKVRAAKAKGAAKKSKSTQGNGVVTTVPKSESGVSNAKSATKKSQAATSKATHTPPQPSSQNFTPFATVTNDQPLAAPEELAEAFKTLGNPHRLAIYRSLLRCCGPGVAACDIDQESGLPCVGDLGKELDIAQSTLSHHVKELHRAGLITVSRHGKNIVCGVDHAFFMKLFRFFDLSGRAGKEGCC